MSTIIYPPGYPAQLEGREKEWCASPVILNKLFNVEPVAYARAELRKLIQFRLDEWGGDLLNAAAASPLIGKGPAQIDIDIRTGRLKEAMGMPTLMAIALGAPRDHICGALRVPSSYGFASTRGKAGYQFGRPHWLTNAACDAMCRYVALVATSTPATTTTSHTEEHDAMTTTATSPVEHASTLAKAALNGAPMAIVLEAYDRLVNRHAEDDPLTGGAKPILDLMSAHGMPSAIHTAISSLLALRGSGQAPMPTYGEEPSNSKVTDIIVAMDALMGAQGEDDVDTSAAGIAAVAGEDAVASEWEKKTLDSVAGLLPAINAILGTVSGAPKLDELIGRVATQARTMKAMEGEAKKLRNELTMASMPVTMKAGAVDDGSTPNGYRVEKKIAADIFNAPASARAMFNFELPWFVWDRPHAQVPEVDENYKFRPASLLKVLLALTNNMRPWIFGPTGSGKTTLVEQVCARLGWPFVRVNLDSEITRLDLVGRDVLATNENGEVISRFEDGIIPKALATPSVLCLDECDFVRSDVAYVLQRALENKGILITEDGGRLVQPHPWSRIVATANTVGQGDEKGMYPGAKVQSSAFLDRFGAWIPVDYMSKSEELKLIQSKVTGVPKEFAERLVQYASEHRKALLNGDILKAISPRGLIGTASMTVQLMGNGMDLNTAGAAAMEVCILDAASHQDRTVMVGIADRVFGRAA